MLSQLNNALNLKTPLQFQDELYFDIETYPNYWLCVFKTREGPVIHFSIKNNQPFEHLYSLAFICGNFCLVGFNSNSYDIPILQHVLSGKANNDSIYNLSVRLVENGEWWRNIKDKIPHNDRVHINTYDLIEPAPDPNKISLKKYSARILVEELEDLPFDPHQILSDEEINRVFNYCIKDVQHTLDLRNELHDEMQLRFDMSKNFNMDLRSLSDAQIGERVTIHYIEKRLGRKLPKPLDYRNKILRYRKPAYIKFQTDYLNNILNTVVNAEYHVGKNGSPMIPKDIAALSISINGTNYKLGIGGLHSQEKNQAYVCDKYHRIYDIDGNSFYPTIIVNNNYCPQGLEGVFMDVYKGDLVEPRLAYKRQAKDESLTKEQHHTIKQWANSMKVVINGLYGKLGSPYCKLYAPEMMISVCLTGQLMLLMLIERLELVGIKVFSANTDGIVTYSHVNQYEMFKAIVNQWEHEVKMTTEWTPYQAVYSRDVNNYIAVKSDFDCQIKEDVKRKGCFADHWFSDPNSFKMKNTPDMLICRNAVTDLILNGTPIEETINNCKDIRQFLGLSEVKGGATFRGVDIGRVARFYISKNSNDYLQRKDSGNKVPNSDRAEIMLNLSKELPNDLYLQYYIDKANIMLYDIGYKVKDRMLDLF